MEKLGTFFLLGLMVLSLPAQTVETVATGLSTPFGLALDSSTLYVCEFGGNRISTINLNQPLPTTTSPFFTGVSGPTGLSIADDFLYFTSFSDSITGIAEAVVRIDLTAPTPTAQSIATGIMGSPYSLSFLGDDLYIASTATIGSAIYRVSLGASSPLPQAADLVYSSEELVSGMVLRDSLLYFGSFDSGSVRQIDLRAVTPVANTVVSGLDGPDGVVFNGSFLYISERNTGRILRLDVDNPSAQLEVVATGISDPTLMAFDGVDLYFSEETGTISRIRIVEASLATFAPVCESDMPTDLGGGSPIGGVYSGDNVTDNGDGETFTFDAVAAGVGLHQVIYSFGAATPDTAMIEVLAIPTVSVSTPDTLAIAGGDSVLGGGMPVGGVYSGPGVIDSGDGETYTFDPSVAGVGVHDVTYTFTDSLGCENSSSDSIEVVQFLVSIKKLFVPLQIAPNPTTGEVFIRGIMPNRVHVFDPLGRELSATRSSLTRIDLSGLPNGLYTIRLSLDGRWATRKVVKR